MSLNVKNVDSLSFAGKKALIRVDFNVPLDEHFQVTDDTRIQAAVPTIQKILNDGGSAILMSHLGRPKGGPEDKYSLKHIVSAVEAALGQKISFASDCIGEEAIQKAAQLGAGQVLLLENLRFYKEEEKGDEAFAAKLAQLGDVYVNDAFGTAHRAHASIVGPPKTLPSAMGRLLQKEVEVLGEMRNHPKRPFIAVLGGAKVSDKLGVIEALLSTVDALVIGGGMCFTFLAAKGMPVGSSICELDQVAVCKRLLDGSKPIHLPEDIVGLNAEGNYATFGIRLPEGAKGLDIGPGTAAAFTDVIMDARTVFWNGPMGMFEDPRFAAGTKTVAQAVADTKAFTVVGGGDSAAALAQFGLDDEVDHVSTGGGASLEYLELGDLPGLAALRGAPNVR